MRIAFIGLGNMGLPMARHLIAAGHDLTGYDIAVRPDGITMADSVAAACADKDAAIFMLPDGTILRAVAAQAIPALPRGALVIDCSTVEVTAARWMADEAEGAGLVPLDAPVSGGIGGAEAGTLTFMVGGSADGFAAAGPVLQAMGDRIVHCGPAGAGQAAKICNNMILGVTMIATCEAFGLADRLGLDRRALFDVVSTSSGSSWSMNTYCPAPGVGPASPADRGYQPGFAAELMLKDLRLSQAAADSVQAATPMGQMAATLYGRFVEAEGGRGKDFSAMFQRFAQEG